MNERIKQLAKEADIQLDYFGLGSCPDGGNPDVGKFAELIVLEVLSKVDSRWSVGDIKQHFGIE
jgi:hypothetical protein